MNLFPSRNSRTSDNAPGISRLYMRLKSRITLYFIIMVILPSVAVALIIHVHTRSLMVQASREAALARISNENNYIGYCLKELELAIDSSVSSISRNQLARLLAGADRGENSDILGSMVEKCLSPAQIKSLSAVFVADPEGIRTLRA